MRFDPEMQSAVDEEIQCAEGLISETEATRRLLRRARGAPQNVYINPGVAGRDELEYFARQLLILHDDLMSIRSRLAGPLAPVPNDPQRTGNIVRWRALSEDLPPRLEALVDRAESLSETLTSLNRREIGILTDFARVLRRWELAKEKEIRETPEVPDDRKRANAEYLCQGYASIRNLLELLGIVKPD